MDLVVGAPHFFERKEEIGGAAYVYINPAGHWDAAAPLRLNGTRGSMFGIALGAAGDLNQDGFEGEGRWGGTLGSLGAAVSPPSPLLPPQIWPWEPPLMALARFTSTTAATWASWPSRRR